MLHSLVFMCNLASAVAAFVAAVFWFRSAKVKYPSELIGFNPLGGPAHIDTKPLVTAARESGRLNKVAARWSAGAAGLLAVSIIIGEIARVSG